MEDKKRHNMIWKTVRPVVRLLVKALFNYSAENVDVEGPYIVLCNHVTDWDPLMLGVAFDQHMHYVASEHILRLGFVSKLLKWSVDPIARQKGGNAAGTVKTILRTVKDGGNVGMFPEGNRTWDGVTRDFSASTGKLVRSCGCTLVTYRLHGGYFSSPRWTGSKIHRGRMSGELVGVYRAEELRKMTVSQINELIARDLFVDAYAEQRTEAVKYRGKAPAERLETMLFTCPKCGAMHQMESHGDKFRCNACGMETRYTDTGFFEGGELPFDDIYSWNRWQNGEIEKLIAAAGTGVIFSDEDIELLCVETAKRAQSLGVGRLALYADRLELPTGISVPLGEIGGMALQGPQRLYLSTADGQHYQLIPKGHHCTVKYLTACGMLGASVKGV